MSVYDKFLKEKNETEPLIVQLDAEWHVFIKKMAEEKNKTIKEWIIDAITEKMGIQVKE